MLSNLLYYLASRGCPSRYSTRLQDDANLDVMTKATSLSKKRNLEGNHDLIPNPLASNSFVVLLDKKLLLERI
jgi:hypothetical protein